MKKTIELTPADRQRIRTRAAGKAQTRLTKQYPGVYQSMLEDELEKAEAAYIEERSQ